MMKDNILLCWKTPYWYAGRQEISMLKDTILIFLKDTLESSPKKARAPIG